MDISEGHRVTAELTSLLHFHYITSPQCIVRTFNSERAALLGAPYGTECIQRRCEFNPLPGVGQKLEFRPRRH